MPKVKINNTQGLVQAKGGGISLFGATESIQSTSATVSATFQIDSKSSLVFVGADVGNNIVALPATGSLDTGHTILLVNTGSDNAVKISPIDQGGGECVNGLAGGQFTIAGNDAALVAYSGAHNPGWVTVIGSADETPS